MFNNKFKELKVFTFLPVCLVFAIMVLGLITVSCEKIVGGNKGRIVYSAGDDGSNPPSPQFVEIGGLLELPGQGGMGHSGNKVLSGWKNAAGETYSIGAYYPVTKNEEVLTAQWRDPTATVYTVLFEQGEGSGTPPAYKEVTAGTIITMPRQERMTAPSGKEFDGWRSGGSSLMKAYAPYKITGNITFVAQWKAAANSPSVTSVTVSPKTASVAKGATRSFSATVAGTNSPSQNVTWSIDQSGKHSGTSINASGLLTVSASETLSTITVRATSTADTTKADTATVTVTAVAPTVTGVTVSPKTTSVEKGATRSFSASVAGTNSPSQNVTWSIDQSGKHSGTSINASGLLTVSASETLSTITVRAISTADTTKADTATVTVTSVAPTVTGVTVSPKTTSVEKGATRSFSASVAGTNSPSQNVTWSIDQSGKHSGTTITAGGLLTVSASETSSKITVRATSKADTTKSGTATVTVTSVPPTPSDSTVTGVTVSPPTVRVEKGATYSFNHNVTGTNNPSQNVAWTIDDSGKHSGTNISTSGVLTVSASETLSTLTVRATSTTDTTKSGTATVTVTVPRPAAPTNVKASNVAGSSTQVLVTWFPVSGDVVRYNIYYTIGIDGDKIPITRNRNVLDTTFTHNVAASTTRTSFYYYVTAVNSAGDESEFSDRSNRVPR